MLPARSPVVLVTLLCGVLTSCPGNGGSKPAPAPCTKLGQQCQIEPGKLGACSYRTNCDGPDCFYCQPQH